MHPGPVMPDSGPSAPGSSVDEPAQPRLSVAAAARRLGVAPGTLRTWDRRYGIGPGEHEPGRHRRYAPDDVARLELMQHALLRGASPADAAAYARVARLPRPDADPPDRPHPLPPVERVAVDDLATEPGAPLLFADDRDGRAASRVRVGGRVLRLPGAGRAARGLGRAALALDPVGVRRLLREAIVAGGVGYAWDEVARPVLVSVAQRWADTGAGIEIEHLISECVVAVFGARTAAAPPGLNPRPVLLAGMPGEQHTLPMVVLAAALSDRRVESRSLGSNLPADALVAAARRTAPAAVVLWSQSMRTADVEMVRGLPRTRPRFRIYVAGPGWADVAVPPRVVRLESLAHAERELVGAVLV